MRIAYVEDNPTNFSLVERVARMAQHTVVSYTEGEIALVALKTEVFDLILMDVELAGEMNGLDLVRELRKGGLKTPIIAVTAYAMLGDREKCIEAGCNEYLPKPLPITDLIKAFAKYAEFLKAQNATTPPTVEAPTAPVQTAIPTPTVPPTPISAVPAQVTMPAPALAPIVPPTPTPPSELTAPSSASPLTVPTPTTPLPVEKVPPAPVTPVSVTPTPSHSTNPVPLKSDNIVDNKG